MTKFKIQPKRHILKQQAARVLVAAVSEFLRKNKLVHTRVPIKAATPRAAPSPDLRLYRRLMGAYEYMGVLMGTWYSNPRFLDESGNPIALTVSRGPNSIDELIRASRIPVSKTVALELMHLSSIVRINGDGTLTATNRVFMLPQFEVPRAALVVERFLDTLHKNFSASKNTITLLERSCHVTGINIQDSAPLLRDIKERGAAMMDVIDGEIESKRSRRRKNQYAGELGVLVFAWTRSSIKRAR